MSLRYLSFLLVVGLPILNTGGGDSWPQWRGALRDGRTSQVSGWDGRQWRLRKVWEKNEWGAGNSAPIIVEGKVFVFGHRQGRDQVYCLEAATGKVVWRQSYRAQPFSRQIKTRNRKYIGGPISTPTYDPATGYLYTYNPDGILTCWNAAKGGSRVWQRDILATYQPPVKGEEFGQISCPLIDGKRLVLEVGATPGGHLVGFDKQTGREVWKSHAGRPHGRSCGPVKFTVSGVTCYASFGAGALVVIRADNGKTVGEVPWQAQYGHYCATPVVVDDSKLLCTSQGKTKTTLLAVSLTGVKPVWTAKARAKVVTPVLSRDGKQAYFCDGGRIRCIRISDGKDLWVYKGRVGGDAEGNMVVTGDDKVIAWGGNTLVLIDGRTGASLAVQRRVLSRPDKGYPHVAVGEGYIIAKARNGQTSAWAIGK